MSDKTPERRYVTFDQIRAAYDALALDPELLERTRSIEITPHVVVVIRHAVGDDGGPFLDGNGELATTTTWLDVVHSAPAPAVLGIGEQA